MPDASIPPVLRFLRRLGSAREGVESTDRHLLRCFANSRDETAFATLVRRHGPMVLGVCRRVLRNAADAEDAFQATFLVLVRKASSVGNPDLLGNWLYGVAYRTALKARSEADRRRAYEGQASPTGGFVPTDEVAAGELRRVLDRELDKLPTKYRTAVVLCYLEGRTHSEAAAQLSCPRQTVTTRLTRACDRLRARLLRRGLALSAGALEALWQQEAAATAVPTDLTGGTVRAASALALAEHVVSGAVPDRIAHIAQGVLQSMLMTRLRHLAASTLLAAALLSGAGLLFAAIGPNETPREGQRPNAPAQNQEPAAKLKKELAEFQKLYALPEGAILKWISPPFPESREAFCRNVYPKSLNTSSPAGLILRFEGGQVMGHGALYGGGSDLRNLPRILSTIYPQQVEGAKEVLDTSVGGDFVVRAGASAKRLIPALEIILRDECRIPVKLSLREVHRKAIVVKGKYRAKPLEGRASNHFEIYGATLVEDGTGGGGGGDFPEFLNWVGMYLDRQLVNEAVDTPKARIYWHYNERSQGTDEDRKADRDERLVLEHLREQTGLTFVEETRRVTVLFIQLDD
jgi:RNA polymerase sigma factor (sigma-70 family)